MDGFHEGERRSTYSVANRASVGPEAGGGMDRPPAFSRASNASAAERAWSAVIVPTLPSVTRRGLPSRRNRSAQDRDPPGWTRSMNPRSVSSWIAYSRSRGCAASAMASVTYDVEAVERAYRSGDGEDWPVRIYQPQGDGPFPVLIDVHGGAWTRGNYLNNENIDRALAATGMLVMALEFRQSPRHRYPAQVEDVNYGTRWAKTHAAEFNGDPGNVGGLGTSSGGHSMMLSALRYGDPRYAAETVPGGEDKTAELRYAITGWPVLDSHARYIYAKEAGLARLMEPSESYFPDEAAMIEGSPQQSLERGEHGDLPPLLILQGLADDNVPLKISERFVETYHERAVRRNAFYFPIWRTPLPRSPARKPTAPSPA